VTPMGSGPVDRPTGDRPTTMRPRGAEEEPMPVPTQAGADNEDLGA
jgi:hypothetical protein